MREKISTEHTPESWEKQVEKHEKGESTDVYARAGYPELEKREKEFAEMIGASDVALFNSGMAVIHTAIEAEDLMPGDTILCGKDVYFNTKDIYERLKKRGIKIELVDSGDAEEIKNKIKLVKPRLIFLEDVANSYEMQVTNVESLIKATEDINKEYKESFTYEKILGSYLDKKTNLKDLDNSFREDLIEKIKEFRMGNNPFIFRDLIRKFEANGLDRSESIKQLSKIIRYTIDHSREKLTLIIDNTLASPALYNPLKDLKGSDIELVVVESGTKHFQEGKDKITLGLAYSNKGEKIKKIKELRSQIGTYLQPIAEKEIPLEITEAMPGIMERHASNALKLAEALNEEGIDVSHPNLETHKNNELVKEIAPNGLVSIFYFKIKNSDRFVEKIKELGGDKIGVGVSFGHPKTWLLNHGDQIRVAVGSEIPQQFQNIIDIFVEASKTYNL